MVQDIDPEASGIFASQHRFLFPLSLGCCHCLSHPLWLYHPSRASFGLPPSHVLLNWMMIFRTFFHPCLAVIAQKFRLSNAEPTNISIVWKFSSQIAIALNILSKEHSTKKYQLTCSQCRRKFRDCDTPLAHNIACHRPIFSDHNSSFSLIWLQT